MTYILSCEECGSEYDQFQRFYWCPECGGKLMVVPDLDGLSILPEELRERQGAPAFVRFREFMPLEDPWNSVSLAEGDTPLLRARNLEDWLPGVELYLKNETLNPTGSFKDRPMAVGLNKAREWGVDTVATASSGNAACSLAALAARARMRCAAFVPADAPDSKLGQLAFYGADVFRVEGDGEGDTTVKRLREAHEKHGWVPVPSFGPLNPYQLEGVKTLGYEIALEMVPEHIVVQVGGAGLYYGVHRAFGEFKELGWIDEMPKVHAVQGDKCSPLVDAVKEGREMRTWAEPGGVANGILDPYTWDWKYAVEALKGAEAFTVTDEEILDAQRVLSAKEGIFAEPTGSVSLAGIKKLREMGVIKDDERAVALVTGHGFKDIERITSQRLSIKTLRPGDEIPA